MANRLQPHPNPPYLKSDGTLNVSGQLKLYAAGTSNALVAYSDAAGTSYGSTIDLDSAGLPESGPIYFDNTVLYKIEVYTRTDDTPTYALDYTVDNHGDPGTLNTASTTQSGIVELATSAETITGTDAARAVTPSGLAARIVTIGALIDVASSSTQVSLTQNTWGKTLIDTVVSARCSDYGAFDLTNERWTATATCTVMVSWVETYSASSNFGASGDEIGIYKTGSYNHHHDDQAGVLSGVDSGNLANYGEGHDFQRPISLVATDYVEVWLNLVDASPVCGPTAMFKVEVIT